MSSPSPLTTDFVSAYLAGELNAFYTFEPGNTRAALAQPRQVDREVLAQALRRYADKLGAPARVYGALEQLEQPQSRAVVTGQQVGLLLGPTYTLSKAVTAVRLAEELSTDEKPVVPVFWVASQDHDTEEIDHAYLLDLDETLRRLELPLPGQTSAGRIPLEAAWIETLVTDLRELNAVDAHREEVISLLRESFEVSESYADWFGAILYRLLGSSGLVVLNPLEPDIAELFKPVFLRELDDPTASSQAINEAGTRLSSLGFSPQLGRGEDATNLFLEDEGRRLLRYDGKQFYTETSVYRPEELTDRLDADPLSLTPAAGLRPVSQDAVLPTAATVVGPGELRYFAQLKQVYEQHGVAMPLIWPRASATILEPPVRRIMEKFGIDLSDLSTDFASVKEAQLLELHGHADAFDETLATLETSLEGLLEHVKKIDPTLQGTLHKGERYLRDTVQIFKTKTAKALENRNSTYARQFDRLEAQLFPLDQPQERVLSPFSFFLKFGVGPVMAAFKTLPSSGDHELRF